MSNYYQEIELSKSENSCTIEQFQPKLLMIKIITKKRMSGKNVHLNAQFFTSLQTI